MDKKVKHDVETGFQKLAIRSGFEGDVRELQAVYR